MSAGMEQLSSHHTDFHEIWYLRIVRKPVRKIQVSLKRGTSHENFCKFMTVSRLSLLIMRVNSEKSCTVNRNTHFVSSNFFPGNRAFYVIMWNNVVQPDRAPMAV